MLICELVAVPRPLSHQFAVFRSFLTHFPPLHPLLDLVGSHDSNSPELDRR